MVILQALRTRGFAVRTIAPSAKAVLAPALRSWQAQGQFRFPPVIENPPGVSEWPRLYKRSFVEHMAIATQAFADILDELEHERSEGLPARLQALRAALVPRGDHVASRQRRAVPRHDALSTSFINFFNYQHGLLAPHRDRCLITIVYTIVQVSFMHAHT